MNVSASGELLVLKNYKNGGDIMKIIDTHCEALLNYKKMRKEANFGICRC
jgi:hypothetical protein